MILGFKQNFPWKEPTYFREKILLPTKPRLLAYGEAESWYPKLHTMRLDPHDRWRAGMSIQMVYRGPKYSIIDHFNKGIPELETCVSVQRIKFEWYSYHSKDLPSFFGRTKSLTPNPGDFITSRTLKISIDGKEFGDHLLLARNDGFDSLDDFYKWFNKDWSGKIMHWSSLKY